MENDKKQLLKGKFQRGSDWTHPGRFYSRELLDKAIQDWQTDKLSDVNELVKIRAKEVTERWMREFKDEK
jgi:hypothetical protein